MHTIKWMNLICKEVKLKRSHDSIYRKCPEKASHESKLVATWGLGESLQSRTRGLLGVVRVF